MRLSMHAVAVGFVTAFVAASSARAQLVINEVDYDQVGTDFNEFIELRNNSNCRIPLADLAIVLVNGTGSAEYQRVSLAGAATFIEPGQYLVVGSASVTSIVQSGRASCRERGEISVVAVALKKKKKKKNER